MHANILGRGRIVAAFDDKKQFKREFSPPPRSIVVSFLRVHFERLSEFILI
jgi:hypothetical protein